MHILPNNKYINVTYYILLLERNYNNVTTVLCDFPEIATLNFRLGNQLL